MAARKTHQNITVKQTRELLKLPWVKDEALSGYGCEARLLPDGRVLVYMGDFVGGTLYPSRDAYKKVFQDFKEMMAATGGTGRIDLTRTLLPPFADFLRDVEAHAGSLGERLRVPDEALDRTEASLDAVDKGVWRLSAAKRMTAEIITPLTAYVGLVILGVCGGRWTTEYSKRVWRSDPNGDGTFNSRWVTEAVKDGNEPLIVTPEGRMYQPFAIVIVETERGRQGSIRGAVDGTLKAHRLEGKPEPGPAN